MELEKTVPGTVHLVGAGPGDEGLITVRGAELLERADVVVYDYLANPGLLDRCPAGCERIYVGKSAGRHSLPQEEINALLVERALAGRTVVRLKGGDPFVFGRGGEEALELAAHGVPFTVVPGVTAAVAAAACAGIPVTQRGLASTLALVTGHENPAKLDSDVDWQRLGRGAGTLAVYMGVKNLPLITERLLAAGRAADTPAALVRWGTLERQQTLVSTLSAVAGEAEARGFGPPAVLLVGDVVRLREKLRWFDTRPLFGRRIVVTRSRAQASGLARSLKELGAEVRELPSIEIRPVEDFGALDRELGRLRTYDWVVFTSVNGVAVFFERLEAAGLDARSLAGVKAAAIGEETAAGLRRHGIRADLVPQRFTSREVLAAFTALPGARRGERFLLPGSEISGDLLPDGLEALGAEVVRVSAYRNRVPEYSPAEVEAAFDPPPDLVTFTSSSTVTHLLDILRGCGRAELAGAVRGACIGPVTAATAREAGVPVALEADPHTIDGLVRAIVNHFRVKEHS